MLVPGSLRQEDSKFKALHPIFEGVPRRCGTEEVWAWCRILAKETVIWTHEFGFSGSFCCWREHMERRPGLCVPCTKADPFIEPITMVWTPKPPRRCG